MNEIKAILEQVQEGSLSVNDALLALKKKPYEDIGFAKVDIHRKLRQGMAEVIYGASKTPEQIIKIIHTMQKNNQKNDIDHTLIPRSRDDHPKNMSHGLSCRCQSRHCG